MYFWNGFTALLGPIGLSNGPELQMSIAESFDLTQQGWNLAFVLTMCMYSTHNRRGIDKANGRKSDSISLAFTYFSEEQNDLLKIVYIQLPAVPCRTIAARIVNPIPSLRRVMVMGMGMASRAFYARGRDE